MWDPNFVVIQYVWKIMTYTEIWQFSIALTYGQEENLRIDWKIQICSDSDVDASSGRTWTVISFEKNK